MADQPAPQEPPAVHPADANLISPVGDPEPGAAQGNLRGARPGEGVPEKDLPDSPEYAPGDAPPPVGGPGLKGDAP